MKPASKKAAGLALFTVCFLSAALLLAWDNKLTTRRYSLSSEHLSREVHMLLLSDLHSCVYGEGQRELLEQIDGLHPDLVLLAGDILDDDMPNEPGKTLLRALGASYPCYYVPGNHEHLTGEPGKILAFIQACGITIPLGSCATFEQGGNKIQICGMDDPIFLGRDAVLSQAKRARAAASSDVFTLLLTHRPELFDAVRPLGYDLVVAGHAHGGQWRLPGGKNGLFAPHQGFFPRYSGGSFSFSDSSLIVSRGLARESTRLPRLCNPPELVLITLSPTAAGQETKH